MRKFFILLVLFVTTVVFTPGQTPARVNPPSADQVELAALNQEMLATYRVRNYDAALIAGQRALEISLKLSGEKSKDTAGVLFNLGAVYKAKKQNIEAIDNFQRSLAIYQNYFPGDTAKILAIYNELGLINYGQLEKKGAEKWFLQALELSEKVNGADNKDTIAYASSLGLIYRDLKEYEKAEAYLWRATEGARKVLDLKSPEYESYSDTYSCFTTTEAHHLKDILAKRKAARTPAVPSREVINGKAKTLARPLYPSGAGSGSVMVRIQINEEGQVVNARAFCGPALLWPVSESAAMRSIFYPTLLKGTPVKVIGIIVYNFN